MPRGGSKGYLESDGSERPVTDEDGAPLPRTVADLPLHRQIMFFGAGLLALLGVLFVLWWGLSFGVWIDNGVYAVAITLILFGLAGMWLVMPNPPVPVAEPARP
jgi:hypothetical protein